VLLCDGRGRLRPDAIGWARRPRHACNVSGHSPRKKRWNYWALNTGDFLFSATIADVDHYVLAFAYFLEFETQRFIEKTAILPPGALALPDTVRATTIFEQGGMRLALEDARKGTRISVRWPDFGGSTLVADLLVEQPRDHETLNVVIPWSRDRFQFTSKQNTLPVSGVIALGDEKLRIKRGDGFACLDFGRGVWKYRTAWNWGASSSVLPDGRTLGLNLGGKWTDGTGMTENGICLDGRLSKLGEDVAFVYDERDFMNRGRSAKSSASTCASRRLRARVEGAPASSPGVHQMFGHYGGTSSRPGERIAVDGAFG
jgi:hypothetical protein